MKPHLGTLRESLLKYEFLSARYAYLEVIGPHGYPTEECANHVIVLPFKFVKTVNEEDKFMIVKDGLFLNEGLKSLLNFGLVELDAALVFGTLPLRRES
jgi:hypothetical protein